MTLTRKETLQPPLTVYNMIFLSGQDPGASAIEDIEGRKTTYEQLNEHVRHIVSLLNHAGFRRNDRIAIALPSGPEMAVAVVALTCSFTTVPLNPSLTASECSIYLQDVHVKALLLEEGSTLPVGKIAEDLGVEVMGLIKSKGSRAGLFSIVGLDNVSTREPEYAKPEDVANILFTSGTTSKPKIVPWTHSMICWGHYYNQLSLPVKPSDRHMLMSPLYHAGGLNNIYRPLYTGSTVICTPGFQRSEFFNWLDRTRPTIYSAVPAAQQSIIDMAKDNVDIISRSRLRFIRTGTTSLPPKILRDLERIFGVPVVESYNSSEVTGLGISPLIMGHEAGILRPVSPETSVIDEKGDALGCGELGEIAVKGPNVFKGYENDPEANSAAFVNGWFRTGDMGYIDEEGYIHLEGRLKDVINKGGEKVAPQEIDNALMEHPAVAEAVAFPVPHPTLGEDINTVVVLSPGRGETERELRSFLFNRLAYFKVPTRIVFVKEMPKVGMGKASRRKMAEMLGLQ